MERLAPKSKFLGYSTEIIRQSKIKGPLSLQGFSTFRQTLMPLIVQDLVGPTLEEPDLLCPNGQ